MIIKTTKDEKYNRLSLIKKNIENIKTITPNMISEFFYWFYITQKSFDFFNDKHLIHVYNHKDITNISFYYLEKGICIEICVIDTDNKDIKRVFTLTITNIIRLKEVVTYNGFEYNYSMIFHEFDVLNKSVYPTLFNIMKNLMMYSILKRVKFLLNGGARINETIPDIFKTRIRKNRFL